jgi:hypothetical protein
MKLFWKAYYKLKLGSNYATAISNAEQMSKHTISVTAGRPAIFYNTQGELIRGWHKAPAKFKETHPLIGYYSSKK